MSSQLPDWMRNPEPAERTTVSWEVSQAWRRSRLWRFLLATTERVQNRYKITQRFPRTTAVLAFFVAVAAAAFIYYLILLASVK